MVEASKLLPCPWCNGTGQHMGAMGGPNHPACGYCLGSGQAPNDLRAASDLSIRTRDPLEEPVALASPSRTPEPVIHQCRERVGIWNGADKETVLTDWSPWRECAAGTKPLITDLHWREVRALYATPPALAAEPVAVKALTWRDAALVREYGWLIVAIAETPFGQYTVEKNDNGDFRVLLTGQVLAGIRVGDKPAAKAAAQADYDQRIRSALSSQPSERGSVTDAMVEAALQAYAQRRIEHATMEGAFRSALKAAALPVEEHGWRDIESAPKQTGARFLVWVTDAYNDDGTRGKHAFANRSAGGDIVVEGYSHGYSLGGWMPLPTPPQGKEGGAR